ncbi:hypothetical protein Nepgr_020793 [Nepenthes gracilis]|uniref:Mediator of RNA polymerase II transcription subunit 17 n=1 Tax=Nepenthes gracilis TaxID=150966 RepID=A0AAD3SXK6_NEPGR|nr:hypothetical protein Nepgr_020793 [Nepenthes gracilis]
MEGNLQISLDKLPIKRLDYIEETGVERFPPDVGYDEKRVDLIRRMDFTWAVEKDVKRQKTTSSKEPSTPWPWQSLIKNLQLAHQELSVIIDLIDTVEANDAATVAHMTKPKPLPNEALPDLAVSAATKLQCFRHLGKYFKQSAKALERQIAREARFYGSLIRLQQNWKVKQHRLAASSAGSEGFFIDLFDNSLHDQTAASRLSSISTVRVDHDSAGMLAVNIPPNLCHSIHFGFLGSCSGKSSYEFSKTKASTVEYPSEDMKKASPSDDDYAKETNAVLREAHRAIFHEMIFDLVSREAFNPLSGVNVTGVRENYLQLGVSPEVLVFISLIPSGQEDQTVDLPLETSDGLKLPERKQNLQKSIFPNRLTYEIYLLQLFHEHMFARVKDMPIASDRSQPSTQLAKDAVGLVSHFCMSLAHRMFSNKVYMELMNLVSKVPYLQLLSHPTWHSRTSSWTLSVKAPQSILHASSAHSFRSDGGPHGNPQQPLFLAVVVVKDDCIIVEGEGATNVVGLFKGTSEAICSMSRFNCDLEDLSMVLLLQIASQVIRWLHEEALMVGIKTNPDFLSLSFELDQGETLSLVVHVDPDNANGCISWWLVLDDGSPEERNFHAGGYGSSETRRFLGYLSLNVLFSTLMDLITLSNGGSNR